MDDAFDEPAAATIMGDSEYEMKSINAQQDGGITGDRPTLENAYREYLWTRTCTLEILVIPATFAERTFSEASSSLYSTYGVLLIGVRAMSGQLQLNPGPDYTMRGGEAAYLIGRPRDVRLLKQTFERMARGDGTAMLAGASGKTYEYALDPRLEHSPFAPRALRRSAADESFVESVQAAAAVTIHDVDPFEALKATHHILDKPRSYDLDAKHLPKAGGEQVQERVREGPRVDRWHTFAPSHNQHLHPMATSASSTSLSGHGPVPSSSSSSNISPSTAASFGPPTPASRPKPAASHGSHGSYHHVGSSLSTHHGMAPSSSFAASAAHHQLHFGITPSPSTSSAGTSPYSVTESVGSSMSPGGPQSFSPSNMLTSPLMGSPPVASSMHHPDGGPQMPARAPTHDFPNGLTDHIIFCSHMAAVDWHSLIKPLRSRLVTIQRAIVIVTEYEIDEEQWEWLSYFPNVFVVEGSPLVASDLARAQIETCHTIIVLSSPRVGDDESVLDEKAIVVYNSVRAHFSHKRILLDLAKPTNSRLVAPEVGRVGIYENPEFIAGHLYDCSLHDTIMAKSFDMPFLMELMQSLLTVQNSGVSLVTVGVPEQCRGAHFDSLFSAFPDCIPVGLLRRNPVPALRKFPYVCICPPQSAIVGSKDQIYLLAPTSFMLKRAAKYAKRRSRSSSTAPKSSKM